MSTAFIALTVFFITLSQSYIRLTVICSLIFLKNILTEKKEDFRLNKIKCVWLIYQVSSWSDHQGSFTTITSWFVELIWNYLKKKHPVFTIWVKNRTFLERGMCCISVPSFEMIASSELLGGRNVKVLERNQV